MAKAIWWVRRDLRLRDNEALLAATQQGAVIPVFIRDETVDGLGTAAKWRLGLGLETLAQTLDAAGSRLILRSGDALEVLRDFVKATGAEAVHWGRYYDKASIARDKAVKAALVDDGIEATSHNTHLLFEPWTVETNAGTHYKVYSPYWRSVRGRDIPAAKAAPDLSAPKSWPESEDLTDWALGAGMRRGASIVAPHTHVGEEAASARLGAFVAHHAEDYKDRRNFPSEPVTSGLSENLTYGEISPRAVWHAGRRAMEDGKSGAEHFLKELVWREFAWHLLYHEPDLPSENHRDGWDRFPWRADNDDAEAWRRGLTGEPFVDAAMREMYVTGTMHNRARMVVASYLTKHLLTDWRVGLKWFEDCLIDWDPASNAMGWQWVAGCGPDAAPYFRVFNPEGQAEKFDKDGTYLKSWIAEGHARPTKTALSYFDAVPKSWSLDPSGPYPDRIVGLKEGRERALSAYEGQKG